jgi:hypothetical protein
VKELGIGPESDCFGKAQKNIPIFSSERVLNIKNPTIAR